MQVRRSNYLMFLLDKHQSSLSDPHRAQVFRTGETSSMYCVASTITVQVLAVYVAICGSEPETPVHPFRSVGKFLISIQFLSGEAEIDKELN